MLDNAGESTAALLAQAARRSGEYDWAEASRLYRQILDKTETTRSPVETARITELLAKARFKHAFQADNNQEFLRLMHLSRSAFEEAVSLYEKEHQAAASCKTKSREFLSRYWTQQESQQRRDVLEESVRLAREAETLFQRARDNRGLAETHLDLLTGLKESFYLSKSWSDLQGNFTEILRIGRIAIREFEELGDEEGLFESLYFTFWMLAVEAEPILTSSDFQALAVEAKDLGNRLRVISDKNGTNHQRSIGLLVAGCIVSIYEGDYDKALALFKEGVDAAEQERDTLTSDLLLWQAAGVRRQSLIGNGRDHSDERRSILQEAQQLASDSIRHLEINMSTSFLSVALTNQAEVSIDLALTETDPQRKIDRLREAIQLASKGARCEDHTWAWKLATHTLGKATYFLALSQTERGEKIRLLGDAMGIRKELGIITEQLLPTVSWDKCVELNYLALIKRELSLAQPDSDKRVQLLDEAVSDMHRCLVIGKEWATLSTYFAGNLARYSEWYGDILQELYRLTKETSVAQRAIEIYEDAINYMAKAKLVGPIAPVRWKIARIHDALGDYRGAFDVFSKAAEDYRLAAKKVSGSASVFGEIASYMDAWSLIEQARLHHDEEHYLEAAEDYSNVASILQRTRTRNHLSTHYMACSLLEKGEALSRDEKQEASVEALNDAVKVFREAAARLEDKLRESPETPDKQELNEWLDITKGRERYSQARIQLEEARVLDKNGEEETSSTKYRTASETFHRLLADAPSEQTRRETETLMLFCRAWANMKRAEVEASPQLYLEAASSFMKAEESTTRKRFRLLALANASMCKALEAGARFRRTQDIQLYSEIKKQLEAAADHYEQAAFKNAADWTRATQAMFDALAYMASAEVELEPKKKTQFYHLAEKHLELASKLYMEAGFQSKSDEALRHLKRARQEKEILLTPAEVLAENPAVTGAVVAPVSLIRDQAVGLEKYEGANVVGNMSLHEKGFGVGSDLTLELEMVNVGKTAATLLKLENLAPEGLELDRQKILGRVEDNYIDMKGKRLEYLKTHEVKIPMKATRKGIFEIRPRVLFVDEKGNYRSYDFEPVALTVRELGISGWLKGPK